MNEDYFINSHFHHDSFIWQRDFRLQDIESLYGPVKYFKNSCRQVWFDLNRRIVKELRYANDKKVYLYTSKYKNQTLITENIIYYDDLGHITTEFLFKKKLEKKTTTDLFNQNYPGTDSDLDQIKREENISIEEQFDDVLYREFCSRTDGIVTSKTKIWEDKFGLILNIDDQGDEQNFHSSEILGYFRLNDFLDIVVTQKSNILNAKYFYDDSKNNFHFNGEIIGNYGEEINLQSLASFQKSGGQIKVGYLQFNFYNDGRIKQIIKHDLFANEDVTVLNVKNDHLGNISSVGDHSKVYSKFTCYRSKTQVFQKKFVGYFPVNWMNVKSFKGQVSFKEEIVFDLNDNKIKVKRLYINDEIYREEKYFDDNTVDVYLDGNLIPLPIKKFDEKGYLIYFRFYDEKGKTELKIKNDLWGNHVQVSKFINDKFISYDKRIIKYYNKKK